MRAVICGTGSAVPDKVLDNEELSQMVDTNDEWIRERTGIARRHIAKKDTCVSLAVKAAKSALEQAAIPAEDIDLLIVSTISYNVVLPCTACEVQKEIGAVHAAAYDLNAACTGFVLAYQSAQSFLQAGFYRTVLIIGSECLSNLVNWQDRGTCILFGDGAGAAVLRAESGNGYLPAAHSDGKKGAALKCKSLFDGDMENQRFRQEEYKMQMDGQEVFKFAVRQVPAVIMEVLEKNTLALDDIDWMILHQANSRIVEAVSRHLKVPLAKFPMNMQEYGNTSSASIPILLDEMNRDGRLKKGQKIILAGFGAGLTWGASILEW